METVREEWESGSLLRFSMESFLALGTINLKWIFILLEYHVPKAKTCRL